MFTRKRLIACVIVLLYLVTWVGGWVSHARQLQQRAEESYRRAERTNEEEEAAARREGVKPYLIELRKGGPTSHVWWCVPVLPGVLLADSDSCEGPRIAGGGAKIVFYYGFGSTELCTLVGWMA